MKFLLVALNAKYIHSNPALYSLRSYALQQDPAAAQAVEIAEYTINQSVEEIAAALFEKEPDVIAFSCYIWNWSMVQRLVSVLHRILPDTPLWLGGPEVSFDAQRRLQEDPALAGVMIGEGEVTFSQLLSHYRRGQGADGLYGIDGLVFRDPASGEIVRTRERELTDISALPFFYEHMEQFQNRILYYESSRGCPYRCSYCLSSLDKRVRLRALSLVKKELQFFLDERVPQVKFIDRTFNCDHAHAQAIWAYLLEHDNGVTNFHFEITAELLTEEELCLLSRMRPGLVQLEIGVQTTNEETLRAIRRHCDLERLQTVVKRLLAGGNIHIHLDLIAGLPYEGLERFVRSFNEVYSLRPSQLQLGFLKVLKGSHMEEMAESYGLACLQEPPYEVLYTKWISYGQLRRLKRVEEMVELYYNSGQFSHVLPVLERQFPTPYAMYEALADFYRERGFSVTPPSRSDRYQILLDFAAGTDAARAALYEELLTFDLYLRENMKSRPAFAPDPKPWQEQIRAFYHKEERERRFLPGYEEYGARQLQRMTHLEVFSWPVQEGAGQLLERFERGEEGRKETALLFDYRRRSPLDANARITVLEGF